MKDLRWMAEGQGAIMSGTTTQVLAWWGAVLATVVFLWDVYKWRTTGPRIRMTVQADIKILGDPELEGRTYILVQATNFGDRPTTLEQMSFAWYANWWRYIRRKPDAQFVIKNPGCGRSFPYKLEVGERWDGMANQEGEAIELSKRGYLFCSLSHACSKRPVNKRILFSKQ